MLKRLALIRLSLAALIISFEKHVLLSGGEIWSPYKCSLLQCAYVSEGFSRSHGMAQRCRKTNMEHIINYCTKHRLPNGLEGTGRWEMWAVTSYNSNIGVARIFDWGRGPKPQITCNNVIRNFRKRNFLWGKDIVEWKI